MTKYCQWSSPLDNIRYFFTKADVLPLSTTTFNEGTIVGIIDVLQTIINRLGLTNEMISDKVIMMRNDLFTVGNAQQTIFRQQTKLFSLKKFD